ncbi:hypothetical protein B0H14DRAFT_3430752 [Mycena olivaceomarginata]|nr:hypothetical protein B0H14DRAFT_3430752 [Mycena olivaceomarginata]
MGQKLVELKESTESPEGRMWHPDAVHMQQRRAEVMSTQVSYISDEPKPIDPHSIHLFYTHWANMPPIPNTLVVFGADPDSFYLGHGRRHSFQNMPDAFAKQVQGVELPITQTSWISFNPTGTKFIARNEDQKRSTYSTDVQDLITHIKNDGVAFATLGIGDSYFVKHPQGGWHARLSPLYTENIKYLITHVGSDKFDHMIKGLLFGYDKSHIFLTTNGFIAVLNEETKKDPEHPLTKDLTEFDKEGWCLEPGSTLCPYSDRYFFLRFKKPGNSLIQIRWELPDFMKQQLAVLKEQTKSPGDQQFLAELRRSEIQQIQMNNALAMQEMNIRRDMSNMWCQTVVNTGNAIMMAGSPYEYREVRR